MEKSFGNVEGLMKIKKSTGLTKTEKLLSYLCDETFLKLWSYPNVYKEDGKELCDLLVVFENHVFIFFDRENLRLNSEADISVAWPRWKKEVIDKQTKTALGAERYIKAGRNIFLDGKCTKEFPLTIPTADLSIHKIIIAHGAREACKKFSNDNISGSLGITYGFPVPDFNIPFLINLDPNECIHVFDSENLEIIFEELDTFYDFKSYLLAKEEAIKRFSLISYCGEEDLLANYFFNFDEVDECHFIGVKDKDADGLMIDQGDWVELVRSPAYKRKKEADRPSYFWDALIQRTSANALNGTLLGDGNVFRDKNAILEMAKEPRLYRRILSDRMIAAIKNFPLDSRPLVRNLSFMSSFYKETGYVFLQIKNVNAKKVDYEKEHRPRRQSMLQIACGAAKNKFPYLKKIIGIAIDAPKFSDLNSEDFIYMDCSAWTDEDRTFYEEKNKGFGFFKKSSPKHVTFDGEFPTEKEEWKKEGKVGRNYPCPCGSGKKYKKCHGR